jgi:hypothetical protein
MRAIVWASLAACTSNPTQVLVSINGDVAAGVIDSFGLLVESGATKESRTFLIAEHPLPQSFGITVDGTEPADPVIVVARGLDGDEVVVTATRAITRFTPHETRHVCIFLSTRCAVCEPGMTCGRRGCEPVSVDPTLEVDGDCRPLDAPDAGPPAEDAGPREDAGRPDTGEVEWLGPDRTHRIDLTIDVGAVERIDHPVIVEIDLDAELSMNGFDGDTDPDSILMFDPDGADVPVFFRDLGDSRGLLFFLMSGTTAAGRSRTFSLYVAADSMNTFDPPWGTPTALRTVSNADGFQIASIGLNGEIRDVGIGLGRGDVDLGEPGIQIYERVTRIQGVAAQSGAFQYATPSADAGDLAAADYGTGQPMRVSNGRLLIVESIVSTKNLTIREYVVLTSGRRATLYTHILAHRSIYSPAYFEGIDLDLNNSTDDSAFWTGELLYVTDEENDPYDVGTTSDRIANVEVGLSSDVFGTSIRNGMLGTSTSAKDGDVALARHWVLPEFAEAGQAVAIRTSIVGGPDEDTIRAAGLGLTEPVAITTRVSAAP